jgi:GNAT superfamily N-acetyltransferase
MGTGEFTIRPMERSELDIAIEWAAREGWNPGLYDRDCFYAADAGGFLVGLLDGRPVGCISAVTYGDAFGFLGFYIMVPEHRGQGLGIRLWQAAMDRFGGRNVGLDGVLAQQDNYRKSGFGLAYRNIRYELTTAADGGAGKGVVPLATVPLDQVAVYDTAVFGIARTEFLRTWIAQPAGAALGVVREGRLVGYGVVRPCRQGAKIGPLFADDGEAAAELFAALAGIAGPGPVYLDVPEVNAAAMALAARHNMRKVFETARMYLRPRPGLPVNKVFGVTTFELG